MCSGRCSCLAGAPSHSAARLGRGRGCARSASARVPYSHTRPRLSAASRPIPLADSTRLASKLAKYGALFNPALVEGDALRFPDGRAIYIRPCYVELYELLRTSPRAVLLGTPGVGKSTAALYFLWRLLHEADAAASLPANAGAGDAAIAAPPAWIVYRPQATETVFVFDVRGRSVHSYSSLAFVPSQPTEDIVLELYDSASPAWEEDPPPNNRTWLVSSPRKAVWGVWAKLANVDPVYMPVLTIAELQRCRELRFPALSPDRVELLHERWGGSARYVLDRATAKQQEVLVQSVRSAALHADLSRVVRAVAAGNGDGLQHGEAPHALLHLMVTPGRPHFPHAAFASDYCRDLVVSTLAEQGFDAVRSFIVAAEGESILGPLRGHLFDRIALSVLFPPEGPALPPVVLRRLDPGAVDPLDEGLPREPRPTLVFRNIAELQEEWRLRPSTVGRPYALNWPSWDAVTRDGDETRGVTVTFWQFSVSTPVAHGLKQAGLTLAAELVPLGARVRFVFVSPQHTPSDAAVSVKRDEDWAQPAWQRGMQQFKLVLELGPAAMLAAKVSAAAMVAALDADVAAIAAEGCRASRRARGRVGCVDAATPRPRQWCPRGTGSAAPCGGGDGARVARGGGAQVALWVGSPGGAASWLASTAVNRTRAEISGQQSSDSVGRRLEYSGMGRMAQRVPRKYTKPNEACTQVHQRTRFLGGDHLGAT